MVWRLGGGALKHLVYLVKGLDKELFDVTVILSDKREPIEIEKKIDNLWI